MNQRKITNIFNVKYPINPLDHSGGLIGYFLEFFNLIFVYKE